MKDEKKGRQGPEETKTTEFLRYFLRAYPGRTALMVGLMVVAGVAESFGVLTLIPVLELVSAGDTPPSSVGAMVLSVLGALGIPATLVALLALMVAMITLKAALLYMALRQVGFSTAQLGEDLRLRFMQALLYARWSHFGKTPMGQYATAVIGEVTRSANAYRESSQLLAAFIQIAAYLAISFLISWRITLATIVAAVLLTLFFSRFVSSSRAAGAAQTRHNRALMARFLDVLQGIKALKAMGREELAWPLLKAESESVTRAQKRSVVARESRNVIYEPAMTLLLAIGLFVMVGVQGQPLSKIIVLAFVFYRIMQNINTLQMRYQAVASGESAFFAFIADVEAAEAAREDRTEGAGEVHHRAGIELRDVWFSYGATEVLRGVDLVIPAGSFVTVTGESGSGKTTMADLILGLIRPTRGEILVDGVPLAEMDPGAWRKSVGYVPQDMLVFNDTIYNNITLRDDSIPADDVERALRLAGAWDFVTGKPDGLEEVIGERGATLSGGQRQRIALARALVRRPSLLVLDEVTAALDPVTERAICATLREISGEVTIFAISHQPALREVADVSYSMMNGTLHQPTESAASL
jgi:ATP-binding cassette subfamily C protein